MKSVRPALLTPKEVARKLYSIAYHVPEKFIHQTEQYYEDGFRSGDARGLRDKYVTLLAIASEYSIDTIANKWGTGLDFPGCPAKLIRTLNKIIVYYENQPHELREEYLKIHPGEYRNISQNIPKAG